MTPASLDLWQLYQLFFKLFWIRLTFFSNRFRRASDRPEIMKQMFEDFCYILTQFPFSISEKELGYFHQEVNVRVASRVDKRLKLRKIPEMFRINKQVFSRSSKR